MPTPDGRDAIRLDKWLWHARFFRSRGAAARAIAATRFRIDGRPTDKAHALIEPGMVLTFALGPHIRVVKVLASGTRRGPASEARTLYEDLGGTP
ncbi:MAG: RNA-binding S4 domain-containing protein [Alphaproteobacteria bacterium]|nr:RNA-binding S4 domain-containing protein [Alphaproteobacteria bacterium]